jgi:hypothetical protein
MAAQALVDIDLVLAAGDDSGKYRPSHSLTQ